MSAPQIYVIDNFLSEQEIINYREVLDSYGCDMLGQIVCNKEVLVEAFWKKHGEALTTKCGIKCLKNFVTISCSTRNQDWHNDLSYDGDTHKILLYLDNTAGTLFRNGDGIQHIKAYPGRAVVFDFRVTHAGEVIPPGNKKYTIGFRGKV